MLLWHLLSSSSSPKQHKATDQDSKTEKHMLKFTIHGQSGFSLPPSPLEKVPHPSQLKVSHPSISGGLQHGQSHFTPYTAAKLGLTGHYFSSEVSAQTGVQDLVMEDFHSPLSQRMVCSASSFFLFTSVSHQLTKLRTYLSHHHSCSNTI